MNPDQISAKQLHAILKVCRKNGVTRLAIEGLSVDLLPDEQRHGAPGMGQAVARRVAEIDEITQRELDEARKAEELALLAIENPLAHEKHLLSDNADQMENDGERELDV